FLVAYTIRWSIVQPAFGELLHGIKVTLVLSGLSTVLSLALGLVVALCRMSGFRPLRYLAYVYIQVFRALSLFIYVLWIYFGIAAGIGVTISPVTAGVIALTVLNSAYMAEIYRSALGAVDPGQHEAAASLGLGRRHRFFAIVFPQALRIAFPSLVNQFVDIVKDSSIVAIIGTTDLMGVTNQLVSYYRAPFELYTLVAFFYLTIILAVSGAGALIERRLHRHAQCRRCGGSVRVRSRGLTRRERGDRPRRGTEQVVPPRACARAARAQGRRRRRSQGRGARGDRPERIG